MKEVIARGKQFVKNAFIRFKKIAAVLVNGKKEISIDVRDLFFYEDRRKFNRFDTIVRYLAIEEYYGANNYGFSLYKKMQAKRVGYDWAQGSVLRFKKLITSFQINGYDASSKLLLDRGLNLVDGSHRLALSLYHREFNVKCEVLPYREECNYGILWFFQNGFSDDEIVILKNKYEDLVQSITEPFVCTLWPPVSSLFDEITRRISKYYNVLDYKDYLFDDYIFPRVIKGVYAVDDIAEWKIDRKIEYMRQEQVKKVRVLYINFRNPNFRVKGKGRNYLSVEGEELKRAVRGLYKNFLSDYHHDIIMHIGDNYYQNVHIRQLFEAKIDLTDFFKSIFNLEYVVLKNDVPYTPSEFPQEAPITKDIDILCSAEDYPKLVESVLNFIGRFKFTYSVIEKEVHEYHKRFNLELNSVLILQFDVFAIDSSFTTSFLKSTLAGRRLCKNLFFIPRLEDELSYRLVEYYKTPSKKHHLEFLINNKDYLDLERVRSQVTFDINSKGFRFAPLIFEVIALLWKAEILIL